MYWAWLILCIGWLILFPIDWIVNGEENLAALALGIACLAMANIMKMKY